MKTVILNNGFTSENRSEIASEVANILGKNSDNDFQTNDDMIIEYQSENHFIDYDFPQLIDEPVYWYIDSINYNNDGTIKSVDIDC